MLDDFVFVESYCIVYHLIYITCICNNLHFFCIAMNEFLYFHVMVLCMVKGSI